MSGSLGTATVMGAGAWGTAVAKVLADAGNDVRLWARRPEIAEEINAAIKAAAEGPMKGILAYTEDPLVSTDIIHDPHSSVFAADFTQVLGGTGKLAKIITWYDNEWGYSCRTADLCALLAKLL